MEKNIDFLVIEKLLKGLYAKNNPDNPISSKIHNLILLFQKANEPHPITTEDFKKFQILLQKKS